MTVVVTGGARGLGRALVETLLNRGKSVLAVDLDGTALEELSAPFLCADATATDIVQRIAQHRPIDMIIHSAGISGTGRFEIIPAEHHAKILALNFEAPLRITCELLAAGAMSPTGTHVFVGSLSSYTGYPGAVSYAASKDGLASFAQSLDRALPKGQRAVCVFPGPMATDHAARYAPDNSEKTVSARLNPNTAAELILKDLAKGRRVIIPGAKARAIAALARVAPTLIGRTLKRELYDKMDDTRL